jgi:hypothetical protein
MTPSPVTDEAPAGDETTARRAIADASKPITVADPDRWATRALPRQPDMQPRWFVRPRSRAKITLATRVEQD